MEDAGARVAILPNGAHPAREAAAHLGIKTIEADLSSSNGHLRVTLSANGVELTSKSDALSPAEADIALFLHTSGTTSRPKGVPLRHLNLMKSIDNIKNTYALTPDDTSLIVMPLFHVHGLIGACLSTLNSGGTVVVPPRFSASTFWQQQSETNSTWYSAVPTIHQILLTRADEDNAPHESFRIIRSCSAALAPTVFDALENRFGAPVLEAYGMTEASHQMSSSPLPPERVSRARSDKRLALKSPLWLTKTPASWRTTANAAKSSSRAKTSCGVTTTTKKPMPTRS